MKAMKVPGPDHPITIADSDQGVRVLFNGRTIAETSRARVLQEADYAAVYYIPKDDVAMECLEPSDHSTYCPYKGDAGYYSISVDGRRSQDAVWVYEETYDAVRQIAGYLAFYPSRVDSIEID